MNLAFVQSSRRGGTDILLSEFAAKLVSGGRRVIGVVQTNTDHEHDHRCDMDVQVLPAKNIFRISQDLGPASRGCRLNTDALEQSVAALDPHVRHGAELLVVNKYGKHEADGRGFRDLIARALDLGIPVLVGVNTLNRDAFLEFASGIGKELSPDMPVLEKWFASAQEAAGILEPS